MFGLRFRVRVRVRVWVRVSFGFGFGLRYLRGHCSAELPYLVLQFTYLVLRLFPGLGLTLQLFPDLNALQFVLLFFF